jgi:hypothetical protein
MKPPELESESESSRRIVGYIVNRITSDPQSIAHLLEVRQGVVERGAENPSSPVIISESGENVLIDSGILSRTFGHGKPKREKE